ncbi:hypothetical protein AB0B68_22635 [Micromonospora sp. NPDC049049]|uniref:hypothetical protein n=1 Tax=Micromonospora sp. NPDC049049 TaxID=3155495 RepID=UPI0033CD6019
MSATITWARGFSRFPSVMFRRLFVPIKRKVPPGAEIVTAYTNGQVTLRSNRSKIGYHEAADLSGFQGVEPGDFVVHGLDIMRGSVGVSDSTGAISAVCTVCRPSNQVDGRFIAYAMRAQALSGFPKAMARGVREGGADFRRWDTLGDLPVPCPPLSEQRRIADFLDIELARVERLAKVQQEIQLKLNERDLAILDSKIEELSCAFGTTPFRRFIASVEQGSSPQCDNVPAQNHEWGVLKVSSVKRGAFHPLENKKLPGEVPPVVRYEIRENDLLVTRANTPALVGAAAVVGPVRRKLMLCDKIFRIRTGGGLDKNYLAMVARGTKIRDLCAAASHGTSQSMANLKVEEIKEWPVPAAPVEAQLLMVAELSAHHGRTAALRRAIERQLDLLVERRQALITAAVTGHIDVTTRRGADV